MDAQTRTKRLPAEDIERSAIRKVMLRLVPFVALMFLINYLDRTAISFAGPNGLNADLGLTAAQFGFASGVFFIGYIFLEVPSNLALNRFGARRWLSRIMVTWGIVAFLSAFAQNFHELLGLRLLLGITEAGFFPGAILFLSRWVPGRYRNKVLALFYVAQPLAVVFGSPLAGALLQAHGLFGLAGWRVMFMGVAIPAIVVGVICWFYLKDKAMDAKWLTDDEKLWLTTSLDSERTETESISLIKPGVWSALRSGRVWLMWIFYFGVTYGLYTVAFFLPTIIGDFHAQYGWSTGVLQQGVITGIVYIPAAIVIWLWAQDAAKRGVRTWHIALPAAVGGVASGLSLFAGNPLLTLALISLIPMGVFAADSNFWVLPSRFLTGAQAAAAVALINTSTIAGFIAPYVTGAISDATGSFKIALMIPAVLMLISALVVVILVRSGSVPDRENDGATPVQPALDLQHPAGEPS